VKYRVARLEINVRDICMQHVFDNKKVYYIKYGKHGSNQYVTMPYENATEC